MYFNEKFSVSALQMRRLGVFNPEYGVDSKMFVDPKLLETAEDELKGAHEDLNAHFAGVVSLLQLSRKKGDMFWESACQQMEFKERSNTGLGFSKEGTDGNGIGKVLARRIVTRADEILPHVEFAPDIFQLVGVFAERLGCDRLSDMLVAILLPRFLAYTDRVTRELRVQQAAEVEKDGKRYLCPRLQKSSKTMILLPKEVLKPLPIALDIVQALDNADLNDAMRSEVNKIFDKARKHKMSVKISELRNVIRSNPSSFKGIIRGYRRAVAIPYDYDSDPHKVSDFSAIAAEIVGPISFETIGMTVEERVERCLAETVDHFKQAVEQNRLSDLLFDDSGRPRKEIMAQRLLYTIGLAFGKTFDVDVSRESNSGVGAVDFRFTVGHKHRSLIELKLSTHARLKDGYYEQLPAYGKAEGIKRLILLIIKVSQETKHIESLTAAIERKKLAIDVVIVDAVSKPSASKRKTSE